MAQTYDVLMKCASGQPEIKSLVKELEAIGWHHKIDPVKFNQAMRAVSVLSEIDSDAPLETLDEVREENNFLPASAIFKKYDDHTLCSADGREFIAICEGRGGNIQFIYTASEGQLSDVFANMSEISPSINGPYQYSMALFQKIHLHAASLDDSPLGAGLFLRMTSLDKVVGWEPNTSGVLKRLD